jgi:hypothetical protein
MAKEEVLIDIQIDEGESVESINSLRAAVKEMTKARNDANLQTAEGRATVQSLNQAIDANNAKIKQNIDALTKQKMNVGNYTQSIKDAVPFLDKFTGGAASAAQGIMGMTKQALTFIATPIGAVIAAIGLSVAALTAYFKGSEEGQDRLAKITTVLSVAMNKALVVFESLGEMVFNAVTGVGSLTDKLGIFGVALDIALIPLKLLYEGLKLISDVTGFTKVIEDTVKAGESIADLYDKIEARENELVVLRAETSAKVLALREKAITQEGDAKRKTVQEAIDLEKSLAQQEKQQLTDKLAAFDMEAKSTGALTEEQKKQRAELVAAIINAESQGAQATIKFQKEIERVSQETSAKRIEIAKAEKDENVRILYGERDARIELDRQLSQTLDESGKAEIAKQQVKNQTELQAEIDKLQQMAAINAEAYAMEDEIATQGTDADIVRTQQELERFKRQKENEIKLTQMTESAKLGIVSNAAGQFSKILGKQTAEGKVLASIQAGVDTYAGANAQLKLPFPYNLFAAATTIATGIANIAEINKFERGGLIKLFNNGGVLNGPSHAQGGIPFSVGGVAGFEAEGGEAIINKRSTAMFKPVLSAINAAGGGVAFESGGVLGFPNSAISSAATSPFDLTRLEQAIASLTVQVAVTDINDGQKNYAQITDRAQF